MMEPVPIDAQTLCQAQERIRDRVHRTPLVPSRTLDAITGAKVWLKCENLQKIGAFKIRGATNAALQLDAEQLSKGLATHSSGNHAQALACAARSLGVPAYVVMPSSSPSAKVEGVRSYGGEITFCEPNLAAREDALAEVVARTGAHFIHPFNDLHVIAGQATAAKEAIEDVPEPFDALIAPVGGGGLLSGTALSAHHFSPQTEVWAAEPEGAGDAALSFRSGKIESAPYIDTIADGLLTTLGDKTLPIIREHVRGVLLVSERDIVLAMRLLFERVKLVVEPSGAVPLAALLANRDRFAGKRVGIILSGGNVDLAKLGGWFA